MRCPLCGNTEDRVIESRSLSNGESIRRRRECLNCNYRFTSYEHIEEKSLMVIKSDGRREPFDIKKIERGVKRSLEKRPVSQMAIEDLLAEIEDQAHLMGKAAHEIPSSALGEMVLQQLYSLDFVAYIRFASVYRKFENVEQFMREIEQLSALQKEEQERKNYNLDFKQDSGA